MFITFRKWTALYVVTLLALFGIFAAILWRGSAVNASKNLKLAQGDGLVLVIDPGHGGFDPGAVAADGTTESRINLEVALRLEELAQLVGVETEMTRREDVSTESDPSAAVRQRKNSDLQNRVKQINAIPVGVLVSLHQNSLPQVPTVHGAQAFYGAAAGSRELAGAVQDVLNTAINDRAKESKEAGSGVYLLKNAEIPAVLVECGFLSNGEETARLNTAAWQNRLALTVLAGVLGQMRAG